MSTDSGFVRDAARATPPRDETLVELAALAKGLVYSSEGEHPFHVVRIANDAPQAPLTPERLRHLLQIPDATALQITTVARVLRRHTELTHPDDHRAQRLRPRYEELQRYLEQGPRIPMAVRAGAPPVISLWLLAQTANGELVGYRTTAVET